MYYWSRPIGKICSEKCNVPLFPEVANFLKKNTQLNGDKDITFQRTDWANDNLGLFDMIIGSDLLYEDQHIELLARFIDKHAKQSCEVILVDPGRGRKNKLSARMLELGYSSSHSKPDHTDYLDEVFKGYILKFKRTKWIYDEVSHKERAWLNVLSGLLNMSYLPGVVFFSAQIYST